MACSSMARKSPYWCTHHRALSWVHGCGSLDPRVLSGSLLPVDQVHPSCRCLFASLLHDVGYRTYLHGLGSSHASLVTHSTFVSGDGHCHHRCPRLHQEPQPCQDLQDLRFYFCLKSCRGSGTFGRLPGPLHTLYVRCHCRCERSWSLASGDGALSVHAPSGHGLRKKERKRVSHGCSGSDQLMGRQEVPSTRILMSQE